MNSVGKALGTRCSGKRRNSIPCTPGAPDNLKEVHTIRNIYPKGRSTFRYWYCPAHLQRAIDFYYETHEDDRGLSNFKIQDTFSKDAAANRATVQRKELQ